MKPETAPAYDRVMAHGILGFRAFHHDTQQWLHFEPTTGKNFLSKERPVPIARGDVHRRIAAFIEQPGEENNDDFSIDPAFEE